MPKQNLLDRIAGTLETLGKRQGKKLTPNQRVAAAQRWNSLADIGDDELDRLYRISENGAASTIRDYDEAHRRAANIGIIEPEGNRADNPFLSDNLDKYYEQSEFLDWCRYNGVRPDAIALKEFRWQTYRNLPQRERQWIANRNGILESVGPEDPIEFRNARTLHDWDEASKEWMGSQWDMQNLPVYESIDEFPDYLEPGWQY